MADPITGTGTISTLLKAQASAPLSSLQSKQDASGFTQQLQKAVAPAKAADVTLSSKPGGIPKNVPRGYFLDITV